MDDAAWASFEAVAPTLPYDHAVTGDAGPHPELAQIRVPTLVLVGGASPDWFQDAGRAAAALVPGAVVQVVPEVDHAVPDAVVAPLIAEFCA